MKKSTKKKANWQWDCNGIKLWAANEKEAITSTKAYLKSMLLAVETKAVKPNKIKNVKAIYI